MIAIQDGTVEPLNVIVIEGIIRCLMEAVLNVKIRFQNGMNKKVCVIVITSLYWEDALNNVHRVIRVIKRDSV